MFEFVAQVHSILRWLIFVVGLAGFLHAGLSWSQAIDPGRLERILVLSFLAVLDVQLLLGVLLLISPDPAPGRWPHALIMVVALALAHVLRRGLRGAAPERTRRMLLFLFSVPLLLVSVGLILLR